MAKEGPLTSTRIFWFWLPLAAMWLMMAIEQPMIAAVIARLPEPKLNLAAFGITFSLALIVESPVIMLLTAGTALPRGKLSYERLLRFTHILAGGLTALHLLIGLTPLYRWCMSVLIGVPDEIIEPSRRAFIWLAPWSAAIAYRRLWQGVLIRFGRTRVVPLTIGARLSMTVAILGMGLWMRCFPGAHLGAIALSMGVTAAAFAAYGFARSTVREHLWVHSSEEEPLTWSVLLAFYLPLALTSLVSLVGQPVLSVGLARSSASLISLAIWPVIMGLVFIGRSLGLSYQEVVVALLDDRHTLEKLKRFTLGLALSLSGFFGLFAVTPAARLWFERISGLSPELAALSIAPMAVLAVVPGLTALIAWQRGLLIHVRSTPTITRAVVLNVVALAIVMWVAVVKLSLTGALSAAIALVVSIAAEWIYLWGRSRPVAVRMHALSKKPGEHSISR